jgi:hypothetical protein
MGYSKESLAKKNVFPQKYDEIRRLDGIHCRAVKNSLRGTSTFNIHHSQVIGINITTLEFTVFYFEYEEPTYSSNSSRQ